jgi:hypothetical protein
LIDGLIRDYTTGTKTVTANLKNTENRFAALAKFIVVNEQLPHPVIGFFKNGRWLLVDGYHKMAALKWLAPKMKRGFVVPIWKAVN